ncbi:MAG TPA: hypothetical protein VJV03_00710 [Pyrinomonadaceae bacterium]|nr:hypothetical protein [Pyrinomonadaceae bacterium]
MSNITKGAKPDDCSCDPGRRQFLENPIKNRVSACRKRLRSHRGRRHDPVSPGVQTAMMAQFPADSLEVRQLVSLKLSPVLADDEPAESVTQEVGIT